MKSYSVIIIGTGPAGMSAANKLVNQGIKCLLLDEQIAAGGQIYRAIDRNLKHEPQRVDLLSQGKQAHRRFNCQSTKRVLGH